MNTVKAMFGMRTKAEKQAAAQAQKAQVAAGRSAEQDAASLAQNQSAADRVARSRGKGVLAFTTESGAPLSPTLGG